jgi:hypothetical protein
MYEDTMMPDYGYETEEQRRKRLEQEALGVEPTPVKQTITTDPRTGQSTMKIEGSVEDLSASNRLTPTVTAPVSPDQVAAMKSDQVGAYDRMLQVESGNRDYDSQGRPVTSPKGAMYAAQVMPNTARDPGFGITPARDQSPEEYNRVGREYYSAMLNKYNGNEQLAQAAYNAGPGRVDQAIRQSQQQGGNPLQFLPRETQNYVQKVGGGQQAAMNRQQVQQAQPQGPVSPNSIYNLQQPQPNQTENMPGVGLQATPTNTAGLEQMQRGTFGTSIPHVEQYLASKGNLTGLLELSQNESNPQWIRNKARQDVGFELNSERQKLEAEEKLKTMSPMDLERAIRERTTGGSWLKAIAFGLLGMTSSAEAEAAKLGIGRETSVMGPDGTPYLIKISNNGTPIDGYNAKTGSRLDSNELVRVAAGASAQKGSTTHTGKMQDVTTGEVYYEKTSPQGIELVDTQGKRYAGPSNNLRPFGIGSDINTQTQLAAAKKGVELMYDPAIAAATKGASYLAEFNAKNGTNFAIAGRDPQGMPLLMDQNTRQVVQRPQGGQVQGGQVQGGQVQGGQVQGGQVQTDTRGMTPGQIEKQSRLNEERLKKEQLIPLEVSEVEQKEYVKTKDDLITKAEGGRNVADARRAQFDVIKNNPQIVGIFNGTGDAFTKAQQILRDLGTGAYGAEDKIRLSEDIRKLSIPEPQKAALEQYMQLNTGINRETLKANSGAGSISDAEQRANKESNMTFIGNYTPFAALNGMSRSQYSGDLARAKADYANLHPEYKTRQQFDSAWSKEQNKLEKQYESVYKARLQMVKPFADANNKNPNDPQALARYRDAVMHSFTAYPVPDYNPQTGRWDFKTANTKKAAMSAILGR